MATSIHTFTEELMGIIPANLEVNPYSGTFRLPTVGSRGVPGTGTASTDIIQGLQKMAVQFAEAYQKPETDFETANKIAQSIEGSLMMEETLSIISKQKADRLLEQLQDLMEEKYGTQHN